MAHHFPNNYRNSIEILSDEKGIAVSNPFLTLVKLVNKLKQNYFAFDYTTDRNSV